MTPFRSTACDALSPARRASARAPQLDVIGTVRVQVLTITGGSDVAEPFNINEGQSSALHSDEATMGKAIFEASTSKARLCSTRR